jgi:hypothetical protein
MMSCEVEWVFEKRQRKSYVDLSQPMNSNPEEDDELAVGLDGCLIIGISSGAFAA